MLPISHDEVVHGKGSMIAKMPGDDWQKFANLRAYYAFMGLSGQEAAVYGSEFAHSGGEWSEKVSLDWNLRNIIGMRRLRRLVRDLNFHLPLQGRPPRP